MCQPDPVSLKREWKTNLFEMKEGNGLIEINGKIWARRKAKTGNFELKEKKL